MSEKENFLVLASWGDIIKAYDKANQSEIAGELAKQIIYYGIYGEMTTTNPIVESTVMSMCSVLIDKSKHRYNACKENGARGGRPRSYSDEDFTKLRDEGLSKQEIADNIGCSVKTVERRLAQIYSDEI